ncbi:sit4 -associating protein-related [Anaeramoeba flamelloides]|uniref:Sit4 -associating protein-related n=1 Tax=Anaeramoeba flamelloides TaxID=1746091 RepID=A0AAV7ZXJ9_9EUKA|nr:sit4 -associating protein-related [Anaeramoeba flamelloides]
MSFWDLPFLSSTLTKLLESESFTIEDLFEDENFLDECQGIRIAQNEKLLKFLSKKDTIRQILQYLLVPPSKNITDKSVCIKYPFLANKIMQCKCDQIAEEISKNESLMDIIFSTLKQPKPLNTVYSSYFSQTISIQLQKRWDQTWKYFQEKNIIEELFNYADDTSVKDLLVSILIGFQDRELLEQIEMLIKKQQIVEKTIQSFNEDQTIKENKNKISTVRLPIINLLTGILENIQKNSEQDHQIYEIIIERIDELTQILFQEIDQLFENKWNSCLHNLITDLITGILKTRSEKYVEHLLKECKLPNKILTNINEYIFKETELQLKKNNNNTKYSLGLPQIFGYLVHLIIISNQIVKVCSHYTNLAIMIHEVEGWEEYVNNFLTEQNKLNNYTQTTKNKKKKIIGKSNEIFSQSFDRLSLNNSEDYTNLNSLGIYNKNDEKTILNNEDWYGNENYDEYKSDFIFEIPEKLDQEEDQAINYDPFEKNFGECDQYNGVGFF